MSCLSHPTCSTPAGHTYTADEQPVCSPLSRQLFPRADAMDPSSQYDLRSWAPQVRARSVRACHRRACARASVVCCCPRPAQRMIGCCSLAAQVAFLAGGTNDFRDASLDAEKKVRSPNWTSAQWLQQYEDLVWQVGEEGQEGGGGHGRRGRWGRGRGEHVTRESGGHAEGGPSPPAPLPLPRLASRSGVRTPRRPSCWWPGLWSRTWWGYGTP